MTVFCSENLRHETTLPVERPHISSQTTRNTFRCRSNNRVHERLERDRTVARTRVPALFLQVPTRVEQLNRHCYFIYSKCIELNWRTREALVASRFSWSLQLATSTPGDVNY